MKVLLDLRRFENLDSPWFYSGLESKVKNGLDWRPLTLDELEGVKSIDLSDTKKEDKKSRMQDLINTICINGGLATRKEVDSSINLYENSQTANQTTQHVRVRKTMRENNFKLLWIKINEQKYMEDDVLVLVKIC